jgi:hypothetical protein
MEKAKKRHEKLSKPDDAKILFSIKKVESRREKMETS